SRRAPPARAGGACSPRRRAGGGGASLCRCGSPAAFQPEVAGPDLGVPPPAGLLIDVIGAVDRPGLYRMNRGDRVYDAIAAAGGLTGDADPTRLPDMAGRLTDGEQIKVPFAKSTAAWLV